MSDAIMVRVKGVFAAALLTGALSAAPAIAQENVPALKIRATNSYPQDSPGGKAMDLFAKRVGELSGGKMQVQVYHSGKLYTEDKSIQAVLDGTVEMGMASAGNHAPFTKAWQALETPYLLSKNEFREVIIRGPIGDEIKKAAEKDGLRAMMILETGGHRVLASNKQIRMPSDARNLKIRTAQSPVILAFYRAVGANPTVIPWGETYLAMANGTVEGIDLSLGAFPIVKLWEVAKNVTTIYWSPSATVTDVSLKWWNDRTPQQRDILDRAAKEAQEFAMKAEDENEVALRELLTKNGVKIYDLTPQERETWQKAGRSTWASMPAEQSQIDRLYKAAQVVK
ncbi:MAG: TRAP transporter substrate-binding protein [Burkholderiaceae bacterium]